MTGDGRVIVGVSQSMAGLQAVRFAVAEARKRGTSLYAVRAWPHPATTRGGSAVLWQYDLAAPARRYVREAFAAALGGPPHDVDITVGAPSGRADVVLKAAVVDDNDLLVVGTPATRWRAGWTTRGCTRGARCAVMVVPPPELACAVNRFSVRRLVHEVTRNE